MNEIFNFFQMHKPEIISVLVFLIIIGILYYYKRKQIIKMLTMQCINEYANYLNTDSGQETLVLIEQYLQAKILALPFFIRIFIKNWFTKFWIVDTIEKIFNAIQDKIDKDAPDIDIIGNEVEKKKL